jgi:hypothetical protein
LLVESGDQSLVGIDTVAATASDST